MHTLQLPVGTSEGRPEGQAQRLVPLLDCRMSVSFTAGVWHVHAGNFKYELCNMVEASEGRLEGHMLGLVPPALDCMTSVSFTSGLTAYACW